MSEQETKELKAVSVYDVVIAMVDQMSAIAWQKLGLQPDFMTGKLEKNLEEAKVAIDLTTHLASFIEPRLEDDDKREIHNLVRNLRLNYVEKAKEETG
jgi:hypothetical protein